MARTAPVAPSGPTARRSPGASRLRRTERHSGGHRQEVGRAAALPHAEVATLDEEVHGARAEGHAGARAERALVFGRVHTLRRDFDLHVVDPTAREQVRL